MEDFISVEVNDAIEENEKAIAAKLRALRVRACIRLDEFAEALGVETGELAAYEDGTESVPASVIAMVCALSGVPFEHFFGEEEEESSGSPLRSVKVVEEQAVFTS